MPLFGAHMSIAGGYHNAVLSAQKYECQAVQLFTKNNNQWRAKDLLPDEVRQFRQTLRKSGVRLAQAHDCYLINLASPVKQLYRQSIEAFVIEMQRAEALGLRYLVTHPGSSVDGDDDAALKRIVQALDEAHARCPNFKLKVLLENTAGQGTSLGHRFEHLGTILRGVAEPKRLGICLDTCHTFAAGYPLAPEADYRETFRMFDTIVGLKWLKSFHVNDSRKPFGSRVDRHAHIGQGCLGLEPFRLLVNDPRFRRHPMLLETPKESDDGTDLDAMNLGTLRGLVRGER